MFAISRSKKKEIRIFAAEIWWNDYRRQNWRCVSPIASISIERENSVRVSNVNNTMQQLYICISSCGLSFYT